MFEIAENFVIPDHGDKPQHFMQEKMAMQIFQPEGPSHYGKFLRAANPAMGTKYNEDTQHA